MKNDKEEKEREKKIQLNHTKRQNQKYTILKNGMIKILKSIS